MVFRVPTSDKNSHGTWSEHERCHRQEKLYNSYTQPFIQGYCSLLVILMYLTVSESFIILCSASGGLPIAKIKGAYDITASLFLLFFIIENTHYCNLCIYVEICILLRLSLKLHVLLYINFY